MFYRSNDWSKDDMDYANLIYLAISYSKLISGSIELCDRTNRRFFGKQQHYQYLHYWIFVSSWLLSYHIGSDRIGRRKLIFVLKNCFVSICLLFFYLSISKIVILREKTNKIVSVVVVVVVVVKCLPGKNNFSSIYWIGLDGFPPRLSASYGLFICPWNLFLCVLKSPRRWEN